MTTSERIERIDYIGHIKATARTLFTDTQLVSIPTDHGYTLVIQNDQLVEKILGTIGDSGLLYITTWENMAELWASIRELDDYGVAQWLLQTATTFRILAFEQSSVYTWWVDQLTAGYCSHVEPAQGANIGAKDVEKSLAIDDEYIDRLPRSIEYRNLLYTNPWFVYLASLQLSYHDLYREILSSEYDREGIRRLVRSEKE